MAFAIEEKLVVAVASSALFRLDVADEIYRSKGLSAYRTTTLEPVFSGSLRSMSTEPGALTLKET